MDIDQAFFTALAYTSITGKELDILSFYQKVEDNYKQLKDYRKNSSKAKIGSKPRLGL